MKSFGRRTCESAIAECESVTRTASLSGIFLIGFLLVLCGSYVEARAANYSLSADSAPKQITVTTGNVTLIEFDESVASYAIGSPDTADVLPIAGNQVYLLGKKIGSTNLIVLGEDRRQRALFQVEVVPDLERLLASMTEFDPTIAVDVRTSNGRLVLTGNLPDQLTIDRVINIASGFVAEPDQIINALSVSLGQQVVLEVRFLEVRRNLGREIGVSALASGDGYVIGSGVTSPPAAAGGVPVIDPFDVRPNVLGATPFAALLASTLINSTTVDVAIRALEKKGLTRTLAEPNLVSLSGETASFLAGGEYPYQVQDENGVTTTEFKEYGVRLTFQPTIMREGYVKLRVQPEASSIDFSLGGDTPALQTRRAEATVELRDGQSFVVAGLLQSSNARAIDQVPFLGSIPVIGALFRSAGFNTNQTELVIVVTPRIVARDAAYDAAVSPIERDTFSSEEQLFLLGKLENSSGAANASAVVERTKFGRKKR